MKYNYRDITVPQDGFIVYKNYYWLCKNGDPKEALFYINYPMANKNENLISGQYGLLRKEIQELGNVSVVFVDIAFVTNKN